MWVVAHNLSEHTDSAVSVLAEEKKKRDSGWEEFQDEPLVLSENRALACTQCSTERDGSSPLDHKLLSVFCLSLDTQCQSMHGMLVFPDLNHKPCDVSLGPRGCG